MAKVLTTAAAQEILRLRNEVDSWGRHLHSQAEIAEIMGVGETTVFRVLHRRGAYGNLEVIPTKTKAEVQASIEKVLAMQAEKADAVTEELEADVPDAVRQRMKDYGF